MIKGSIIIIVCILIDQSTKLLAAAYIPDMINAQNPQIVVIPYLLELSYFRNYGASLGIFHGQQLLFMMITVFALGLFGYLFLRVDFKTKKIYSISISLFIGGTLGNAIDRALYGNVIDFLHYPFLTPILGFANLSNFYNNFADLFLSAAIVLFTIDLFFFEKKRELIKENTNE